VLNSTALHSIGTTAVGGARSTIRVIWQHMASAAAAAAPCARTHQFLACTMTCARQKGYTWGSEAQVPNWSQTTPHLCPHPLEQLGAQLAAFHTPHRQQLMCMSTPHAAYACACAKQHTGSHRWHAVAATSTLPCRRHPAALHDRCSAHHDLTKAHTACTAAVWWAGGTTPLSAQRLGCHRATHL
jgi:hypothetical protein